MPDTPESNEAGNMPEVSTEAQRLALDAMSEELVQKLNRMIEEQEARVQEFAVQNPSLSSLPATPKPIELPVQAPVEEKPLPAVPPPPMPPRHLTPRQASEEFERRWKQKQREKRAQEDSDSAPRRNRNKVAPVPGEKQSSNIGSWIFFIVVVITILRACAE